MNFTNPFFNFLNKFARKVASLAPIVEATA